MSLQTTASALPDDVAALGPWFHNLHLPGGVRTAPEHPLGDFPSYKWAEFAGSLPADLSGARALDIGCNAGYYTFELAKRGADVVGIDHDPHFLRQARWAAERLGLSEQVELRQLDVYDLARLNESFDVVLFLGVLYHLRHPLLGLDLVAERTRGTLVLQTLTSPVEQTRDVPDDLPFDDRFELADPAWPSMAFIEHRLADDPTNWWAPSPAAVEAMVRSAGLRVVDQPGYEIWVCERDIPFSHGQELGRATGHEVGPMQDHASTLLQERQALDEQGYVVLRSAVAPDAVATALRRLNLAIRQHGLTAEDIATCQLATFFPHLRWEPEIWGALPPAAAELLGWQEGDRWGDPQILLRFPDEEQPWILEPHVDALPEWAQDRSYRGIVGVALTDSRARDGAVCVWPRSHVGEHHEMVPVELLAGDAVVMHPQLGHTGTLNLGPTIRTAIYFRLLAGPTLDA